MTTRNYDNLGIEEKKESNATYLRVRDGSICITAKKTEDEEVIEKLKSQGYEKLVTTDKEGKDHISYVNRLPGVSGYVTDLFEYSRENGGITYAGYMLELTGAERKKYQLQLPLGDGITNKFMKVAENIDWNVPVRLVAFKDNDTGKTTLWISQNGKTVPQKYTQKEPNGLPEWKKLKGNKYDTTAHDTFLYDIIDNTIIPAIKAANEGIEIESEDDGDISFDFGANVESHEEDGITYEGNYDKTVPHVF